MAKEQTSRRRWRWLALGVGSLAVAGGLSAFVLTVGADRPTYDLGEDGIALDGYDPVAYFPEGGGAPQRGQESLTASVDGRTYRFASAENRDRFTADPARYEPQYGGWCAYAVAHDYKFEADPESYLVVDERLFVFYRGAMGDARDAFESDGVETAIASADRNWPRLRGGSEQASDRGRRSGGRPGR